MQRNAALTIDARSLSMGLKQRRAPGAAIRGASSPSRAEPNRAVPSLQHPDPQLCSPRELFSSRHPSPGPTNLDLPAGRGVRRSRRAAVRGELSPSIRSQRVPAVPPPKGAPLRVTAAPRTAAFGGDRRAPSSF